MGTAAGKTTETVSCEVMSLAPRHPRPAGHVHSLPVQPLSSPRVPSWHLEYDTLTLSMVLTQQAAWPVQLGTRHTINQCASCHGGIGVTQCRCHTASEASFRLIGGVTKVSHSVAAAAAPFAVLLQPPSGSEAEGV